MMEAILRKTKSIADSKSINFLVVIQPSVVDITKDSSNLNYEYLKIFARYKRTNLSSAIEKICIINNIKYVNLFDVFLRNNPENLFFSDGDDHWNDQGQDLSAKVITEFINNMLNYNENREAK